MLHTSIGRPHLVAASLVTMPERQQRCQCFVLRLKNAHGCGKAVLDRRALQHGHALPCRGCGGCAVCLLILLILLLI